MNRFPLFAFVILRLGLVKIGCKEYDGKTVKGVFKSRACATPDSRSKCWFESGMFEA